MRWLALLVSVAWFGMSNARAQSAERLPKRVVNSTGVWASCYEQASGKLIGSMLVRGPVLVSPKGYFRAYSENEAVALKQPEWPECANTSRLFVAGRYGKEFNLIFLQPPDRESLVNWLSLVDWSPDGHYLLFELGISTFGSDAGAESVMLYDAYHGVFWPQGFAEQAVTHHFDKSCYFVGEALGFSPQGKIVLRVSPDFDEENVIEPDSCVKQDTLWLLDPYKSALTSLPNDYKVQHYGRFEAPSPGEKSHGR